MGLGPAHVVSGQHSETRYGVTEGAVRDPARGVFLWARYGQGNPTLGVGVTAVGD